MENFEKNLTPEQSLTIITNAMEQSRKQLEKSAGTPMILWGVLVFVFSLAIAYLWQTTGKAQWNFLWFAMTVIGYFLAYQLNKKKSPRVKSFVSSTIEKVWLSFGILSIATPTLIMMCWYLIAKTFPADFFTPAYPVGFNITLIIISMLSMATTITGFILKNGWIVAAGLICGVLGIAYASILTGPWGVLILTGLSVIGLIIPGIIINVKSRKNE